MIKPLKSDSRFELMGARLGRSHRDWLTFSIAPSLTLNNPKAVASPWRTLGVLCFGLLIQATAVVVNGLSFYRWHWLRAGRVVAPYGYHIWLAGTASISIGVAICAYVASGGTFTILLRPKDGNTHLQIFRVQKAQDTKGLGPFMILHNPADPTMKWSRTEWKEKPWLIAAGAFFALAGFVCQNIGTRELHWSAGVLQLGATLILTALRAFLRQHIGDELNPKPHQIRGSPACNVPFWFKQRRCWSPSVSRVLAKSGDEFRPAHTSWMNTYINPESSVDRQTISDINGLLSGWISLASLHDKDELDELNKIADSLTEAMGRVLSIILSSGPNELLSWSHGMYLESHMYRKTFSFPTELNIVPVVFSQSENILERMKAIISFTCEYYQERATEIKVLQVVGSFAITEVELLARQIRQFVPEKELKFLFLKSQEGQQFRKDHYEIFGLQFSGMLAERYIPISKTSIKEIRICFPQTYINLSLNFKLRVLTNSIYRNYSNHCDIVVKTQMGESQRKRRTAMELFASFLRGIAEQYPHDFAEFVGHGRENIDRIAETLVDFGICDELWEGRIPVISVILAYGIPLVWD